MQLITTRGNNGTDRHRDEINDSEWQTATMFRVLNGNFYSSLLPLKNFFCKR